MRSITRRSVVAASLTLIALATAQPTSAGEVTFQFVEVESDGTVGVAGTIGATMAINSPPVDLTPGAAWEVAGLGDITSFAVVDPNIGPTGEYPQIAVRQTILGSGPLLVSGQIEASLVTDPGTIVLADIVLTGHHLSRLQGEVGTALGDWVVAPTLQPIPEPSTLALAGLGALIGAGAWYRRRRAGHGMAA
jgi:hypothetical protein